MKLDTLKTLYINELRDLYNAEHQLIKALPKMAKAASSEELQEAFEKHLEQTKTHVERLEEVFKEIGEKPKSRVTAASAHLRNCLEGTGQRSFCKSPSTRNPKQTSF
jgi:ferritin-like metal-binding protein YciE